jgi:invasion protein IalB
LIAILPVGSALAPIMNVLLDGTERIQLGYFLPDTCDISTCPQRAPMSSALLERLTNAKAISLRSIDVTGRELSIPLPCCGFKAAFYGAPTPADGKDDELHITTNILRRRVADFMRMDWEKLCFDVAPDRQRLEGTAPTLEATAVERSKACYTYTEVRDWQLRLPLALIGVLEIKQPGKRVVAALFPHFGITPRDPGSIQFSWEGYVDYSNMTEIKLAYLQPRACDPGCYAQADMPDQLLDQLKSANFISYRLIEERERRNTMPCCGFSAALNGAPVASEAQDETQREIQEVLRQHFADLMQ